MSEFIKNSGSSRSISRTTIAGWVGSIVVLLGVTLACESDPILAPQNQENQNKGSYGIIQFDPQGRDKAVKPEDTPDTPETRNPKRF